MFYKPDGAGELSQAELDAVRSGFTRLLVRRRYHPQFIFKHCDELLATAHAEYVRCLNKDVEIEDPVAWMIHCAWRRMQNVLTASNCRPTEVSSEVLAELVDEATPTPAQLAEDADRMRKVHRAIAKLDLPQRQIVALMYFEEMPLAEAARRLGWHESKARRCHEAAMKRLYKSLAVKSSDQLVAEVGLAAWLSFVGSGQTFHLPTGFESVIDKAGEGASGLWARAHDLARRLTLPGAGDTTPILASSGSGRAVGACATVAVACVMGVSGAVGPGIGGLSTGDESHVREPVAAQDNLRQGDAPNLVPSRSPSATPRLSAETPSIHQRTAATSEKNNEQASVQTAAQQVQQQTDGFARAEQESSTSESGTAVNVQESASSSSAGASSSGETQTKQQFSSFR